MSDTATPETTTDTGAAEPTAPETGEKGPDLTAEVEKWKSLSKKNEERAKANATAARELEQLKAASMSDIEKAVTEAKQEGRKVALAEVGTKVAAAEFRAAAAGKLTAEQVDALVGRLNLASFLDDNGDVDRPAVAAYVAEIAPAKQTFPDLGQGQRQPATTDPGPGKTRLMAAYAVPPK